MFFSSVQELELVKEKLQKDYERLKTDDVEKEKRLREFNLLSDKREQAKQDLKGTVCVKKLIFDCATVTSKKYLLSKHFI